MNARILTAYGAMCLIWGTTWLGIKYALQGFPPIAGAGMRFIVAGAFVYALGRVVRTPGGTKPPLKLILVLALTMFGANYALTYYAETGLASGLVAVLFGTLPFFVFGLGAIMIGERVNLATVAGSILALAGVALISLGGMASGAFPFILATLLAAFSSAFANVYLKRYAASDPFTTLAPAMLVAGCIMFAGGAMFEHIDWRAAFSPTSLGAVAYLAILGSGVAFSLNHWLLQRLPSWIVGLSALVIPVIAVIVGALFGGEFLGRRELIGAALVIGGVWLAIAQRHRAPTLEPEHA